jgi:hypothetical protein
MTINGFSLNFNLNSSKYVTTFAYMTKNGLKIKFIITQVVGQGQFAPVKLMISVYLSNKLISM